MTNKQKIKVRVAKMQERGWDIDIDSNSNGIRFTNRKGDTDISPRMTPKEAILWLSGFDIGWEKGAGASEAFYLQKQNLQLRDAGVQLS